MFNVLLLKADNREITSMPAMEHKENKISLYLTKTRVVLSAAMTICSPIDYEVRSESKTSSRGRTLAGRTGLVLSLKLSTLLLLRIDDNLQLSPREVEPNLYGQRGGRVKTLKSQFFCQCHRVLYTL